MFLNGLRLNEKAIKIIINLSRSIMSEHTPTTRVKRRAISNGDIMDNNKYKLYNKDQLIRRILELEGKLIPKTPSSDKPMDWSKYGTRQIIIRFAYLGWEYCGLAAQSDELGVRTIMSEMTRAMERCRLIKSGGIDSEEYGFSMCGRTDRGVSAMNQVISLKVRSNFKTIQEINDTNNDKFEIGYLNNINGLLPDDIRIHSICLHPPNEFNARFSCKARHYRYFFFANNKNIKIDHFGTPFSKDNGLPSLNIKDMQIAAEKFLGIHDFRNFCKIDGSKQINNYMREMIKSDIVLLSNDDGKGLYYFDLIGTAFLWHQVRYMMAILFLVGRGLEQPSIVDNLLDPEIYPSRPIYDMAKELPLVLYDCIFEPNINWQGIETKVDEMTTHTSKGGQATTVGKLLQSTLTNHSYKIWYQGYIKNTMESIFKDKLQNHNKNDEEFNEPLNTDKVRILLGDGYGRPVTKYIPLSQRPRLGTPEEINAQWLRVKGGGGGGGKLK